MEARTLLRRADLQAASGRFERHRLYPHAWFARGHSGLLQKTTASPGSGEVRGEAVAALRSPSEAEGTNGGLNRPTLPEFRQPDQETDRQMRRCGGPSASPDGRCLGTPPLLRTPNSGGACYERLAGPRPTSRGGQCTLALATPSAASTRCHAGLGSAPSG